MRLYAPFCSAVRGYGSSQKDKTSKTTTGHGRKSRLSLATTKSKLLHCGRARLPDEDADTDADEGYTLSPNNLQAWIAPALFKKMYQSPHQQKRKQKQKTENQVELQRKKSLLSNP